MKACVFFLWELAEIKPLYPANTRIVWSRVPDNRLSKGLGIRILELDYQNGLIAEIGSGQPVASLSCLQFWNKKQSALPKSEIQGVNACGHDFHQTRSSRSSSFFSGKRRPTWRTMQRSFSPQKKVLLVFLATGLLERMFKKLWFSQHSPAKKQEQHLSAELWWQGWEFKVTVTGVSSHAARPDLGVDTVAKPSQPWFRTYNY